MKHKRIFHRRDCLKFLGAVVAASISTPFFISPADAQVARLKRVVRTLPLMSTYVTITIYDNSRERALEASYAAFAEMERLVNIFNRFDKNALVGFLNDTKKLTDVPPELLEVLSLSHRVYRFTGGRFDITVLPLLEITKSRYEVSHCFPSYREIQEILPYVGWKNLSVSRKKITLTSGAQITLDGIAKGYIVDRASEVLRDKGIKYALLDAGGDIKAVGDKGGTLWRIGVEDPTGQRQYVQRVKIKDLAIATSGNYINYFDPSKRHFHIINIKNGSSPSRITSCSVIAKRAVMADALATGFYLFQPEKGISLANEKGIPVAILTHGDRLFVSSSWKGFVG